MHWHPGLFARQILMPTGHEKRPRCHLCRVHSEQQNKFFKLRKRKDSTSVYWPSHLVAMLHKSTFLFRFRKTDRVYSAALFCIPKWTHILQRTKLPKPFFCSCAYPRALLSCSGRACKPTRAPTIAVYAISSSDVFCRSLPVAQVELGAHNPSIRGIPHS